jgi:hypothetical protein
MNFDKKLKFDNKGKAVFSKQNDNGETIQYEVTDISKQLGPGTWNVIHTMSFYCKTEDQQSCAQFIKMIIYKYPCESCRKHAISYLKYNPMKKYLSKSKGLFKWTVKFHNYVNHKLHKPIMSYEMAYEIYKYVDQEQHEAIYHMSDNEDI